MIGRIYKITSINTDKIYIGSTTKKLTARLGKHENNYKAFQNGKYHFVKSYDVLEKENYKIELLEEIEYETKRELLEREGYYILNHRDICVNNNIPGRTHEQYRKDNIEKIKQYYKDNADKIRQVNKQYRKDNRDKIKQYRKDNANKLKEKLECLCGGRFTRHNKIRHERTKIHIAFNNQ